MKTTQTIINNLLTSKNNDMNPLPMTLMEPACATAILLKPVWITISTNATPLGGKGTVSLNVSDLFNSYNSKLNVSSFGVQSTNYAKSESQFVRLAFNYRFGNKNVKATTNRKNAIEN